MSNQNPLPVVGEFVLSGKTSVRLTQSFLIAQKVGVKNPIFLLSASSTAFSSAALLLSVSAKVAGVPRYNFLVKPLIGISCSLDTASDYLEGKLNYSSLIFWLVAKVWEFKKHKINNKVKVESLA